MINNQKGRQSHRKTESGKGKIKPDMTLVDKMPAASWYIYFKVGCKSGSKLSRCQHKEKHDQLHNLESFQDQKVCLEKCNYYSTENTEKILFEVLIGSTTEYPAKVS